MDQSLQQVATQLAANPGNLAPLAQVEQAYLSQQRHEELLRVYELLVRQLKGQGPATVAILGRAAALSSDQLGLHQRAEQYLKRVVTIDPNNLDALQRLQQIYLDLGDAERASEYAERALTRVEDQAARAAGYVALGRIYRESLERQDKAITAFSRAHRYDPRNLDAIRALGDVYQEQERWEQLTTYLLQEFIIDGPTPLALGRIEKAVQAMLKRPVFHRLARRLLDQLRDANVQDAAILALLQAMADEEQNWAAKAQALASEAQAATESDPASAAEQYVLIAEYGLVYGKDPANAEQWLDSCFAVWPANPMALDVLERIYGSQNRWKELAAKLETMAAYSPSPQAGASLLNRAAMIFTVRSADPDSTARIYSRILQIDPGNKAAATALAEYYRERKRWDDCLGVLAWWGERATGAADKVAAYYAMCRILEDELKDRERAQPYYQTILQLDPEHIGAATALEPGMRQRKDHAGLAQCLTAMAKAASGALREQRLGELMELQLGPLGDREAGLRTMGELVRAAPSPSNIGRYVQLANSPQELHAALQVLADAELFTRDEDERSALLLTMAALYETRLQDAASARTIFQRILHIDPANQEARDGLARVEGGGAAAGDMHADYRQRIGAATDPDAKVALLKELAGRLIDEQGDRARAVDALREALRLAPDDTAVVSSLATIFRLESRLPDLANMLERQVAMTTDPAGALPLKLELAQVLEQLDHKRRAAQEYQDVLQLQPGHAQAVAALERLLTSGSDPNVIAASLKPYYVASEQWPKVVEMTEVLLAVERDGRKRLSLLLELAGIQDQRLADAAAAMSSLVRALRIAPEDEQLQARIEALAADANRFIDVAKLYVELASALPPFKAVGLWLKAADLFARRLAAPAEAAQAYLSALAAAPNDTRVAAALGPLFGAELAPLVPELAAQQWRTKDKNARRDLYKALARPAEKHGDPSVALALWREVAALEPSDADAQAAQGRLAAAAGDPNAQAEALRQRLGGEAGEQRLTTALQLAELLAGKLAQPGQGLTVLEAERDGGASSRELWTALVKLYDQLGQPAKKAQALASQLELLGEGPERVAALVGLAELELGQGQAPQALHRLEEVLLARPDHAPALTALERALAGLPPELQVRARELLAAGYAATGRPADAAKALEALLTQVQDGEARLRVLRQLAELQRTKLKDPHAAYKALERAFAENPADDRLRREVDEAAGPANAWAELATAYHTALGVLGEQPAARRIARRVAELLEQKLGRPEQALEYYQLAGASDGALPDDQAGLEAMERLLRQQQRLADLAPVLERLAGLLPDSDARKRALLREFGQLADEQLGDADRAISSLQKAVALDARDKEAWALLDRLYEKTAQHQLLGGVLQKRIELAGVSPEVVDLHLRRARLLQEQLADPAGALAHYKTVLVKKRNHEGAVAGLEALLPLSPNKLEIAQLLEPLYTAKQAHDKLAWVLDIRLESTTDATQRKGLLRRIGDIFENRLAQKERAFLMARRALAEDPADMGVRMWIEKLAAETNAFAELAEAYVEQASQADEKTAQQFRRRAAAFFHEKLADLPAAVAQYRAILAAEPKDEKALAALEAIFRQQESFADLASVLAQRAEQTVGLERRREILSELGGIYADRLNDATQAVAVYRQILTQTPDDTAAYDKAEALLAASAQWEPLAELYQAEIARLATKRGADPRARRIVLMLKLVYVLDNNLADPDQATELLKAVLAENPTQAEAWGYLEQRIAQGQAAVESTAMLEQVYATQEQWPRLAQLLEGKLARTPEREARREIYGALADVLLDKLAAGDRAFMTLCRAYDEDRGDAATRQRLEALAEKTGAFAELSEVYAESLDSIADQDLRLTITLRLAEIAAAKLQQPEQAISWYGKALEVEPRNLEILSGLDAMLARTEKWSALTEIMEREIELATTPERKVELLGRLAEVWGTRLGEAEPALRCHKLILELDPNHPAALKSVEKIYEGLSDWDSLSDNLRRQAEVLVEPEEQARVHKRLAELFTEEFSDYGQAITHWQKVLSIHPTDEDAQGALEVLLTSEERWEELAEHYRLVLSHTDDERERGEYFRRLGVILGEKLGRNDDALQSWKQVLQRDPKNLDALRALHAIYRERGAWDKFEGVATRALGLVSDPVEAQGLRSHLVHALAAELGKKDEAIKLAKEYLRFEQLDPEQLQLIAKALEHAEAWGDAAAAWSKAGEACTDEDRAVSLFLNAANLWRDRLSNERKSIEFLEQLRQKRPSHLEAFERLHTIYQETVQWRKLVALDEDFVSHAEPEKRRALLVEIRDVQENQLGEKELAFIAACRAYTDDPASLDNAIALERLGEATSGIEEAVGVLDEEVENVPNPSARIEIYRRIAALYADKLSDVGKAEATIKKILEVDPNDLAALDYLAALGAREERFDKQVQALENKLTACADVPAKKAVLADIARVWEAQIGDIDEAIGVYQRILELDAQDRPALEELRRIYTAEQRWVELVDTLAKLVGLATAIEDLVALQLDIARTFEAKLNQPEDAIRWYNGILEIVPTHAETLTALENLYTGLEHWRELVQVFEYQLAVTESVEDKVTVLGKMAAIYESEFEAPKEAVTVFERVLELDGANLKAIINIERLLRQVGEWSKLIEILQRHISLLKEPDEIVGLYLQIGEIYYKELSRVDKAEEVYNAARDFDPNNPDALLALSQLYERSGNWFSAIEMLQRGADVLGQDPRAVKLLYRMAKINEEMLLDMGTAKQCYERALAIDDGHLPTLAALREIAKNEKDWDHYIEYLIAEADNAEGEDEKAELHCEAAEFFREARQDDQQAAIFYEKALASVPGYLPAANPLAELLFRNEQWQRAAELYQLAVAALDPAKDARELAQKHYRLGYIAEKLGDRDAALNNYQRAFDLDPTYLPALEGLGQALLSVEAWEEAQKVFQTMLIHHRDSLTESEIVDVQYQLGELALKLGDSERAVKQLEKTLEIDPDHPATLRALARLAREGGQFEQAYTRLLHLADVLPMLDRVPIYVELAELCVEDMSDVNRAIEVLQQARQIAPESAEVLMPLAQLLYSAGRFPEAVELYTIVSRVAVDPGQQRDVNHLLGDLYAQHLKVPPRAVEHYNKALDADPTHVKSFEAIERILAEHKQWGMLEEAYRRMIERTPAKLAEAKVVLWRNLGELYRRVVKNLDGAIMAYQVVTKLKPDSKPDAEVLASLYAQKPEHRGEAIRIQHEALASAANPVPHARELRALYHADENFDAVHAMCSALVLLGEATDEERQIWEYLSKGLPPKASAGLNDDLWKALVYDPGVLTPIGEISGLLLKMAPDVITSDIKNFNLKKKDAIDLRSSMLLIANSFKAVARVLGTEYLQLFVRGGSAAELTIVPSNPPGIAVGDSAEVMRSAPQKLLAFHLGRNMAYARPELYLGRTFPGDTLADVLFGLIAVFNPAVEHNANPREVERWAKAFAGVPQQFLRRLQDPLRTVYGQLMDPKGREAYLRGVELTAIRAGYLVANDLLIAAKAATDASDGACRLDNRLKVRDLVLFTLSRNYLKLRQVMGLGLRVGKKQPQAGAAAPA